MPTDLKVKQVRGKMYLSWKDRSLCESGFSFEREGTGFAPAYFVETSTPCFVPHAPAQVYDDLVVATEVALGSNQTYCVRAINSIGYEAGYRSDPACVDVTIAWEAVVRF
jgi:hypothetical protein